MECANKKKSVDLHTCYISISSQIPQYHCSDMHFKERINGTISKELL